MTRMEQSDPPFMVVSVGGVALCRVYCVECNVSGCPRTPTWFHFKQALVFFCTHPVSLLPNSTDIASGQVGARLRRLD